MKKFYIETYGCQMNVAQSSQLRDLMIENSFSEVSSYSRADIIIINACSVREHAERKVFNRIIYFNLLKKKKPDLKILVAGCFAQNNKEKINSDIIIGASRMMEIPGILMKEINEKYMDVKMDEYRFFPPVQEELFPFRSLVDITKGCNNYCSYCVVPYVRGPQVSRKSGDICNDVKQLADKGVKEIVLLGQNVNSYGMDNHEISFSQLLYRLHEIDGIKRIRFLTSHPKDFTDDIISTVFELKKVVSHIHLPLQSGSNRILKLMNRKYTSEKYFKIVEKIRSYNKEYALSTDFLVGFPGEEEDDFLATIDLAKKIRFNVAFTFRYSSRPSIAPLQYKKEVTEEEKKRRLQHLISVQKTIEKEKALKNMDQNRTVLIEKKSKKDKSKFVGRDEMNYQIIVDDNVKIGELYNVNIYDVKGITLLGTILTKKDYPLKMKKRKPVEKNEILSIV